MTCPVPADLARFVDGHAGDAEQVTIEEHLDTCESCRATVSAAVRDATSRALDVRAVGRYELLEPLGAGGMGVVYVAFDPDLERKIAIKVLPVDDADDPARRARLLQEARALAKISHPNVVPVHDVGITGDRMFVAMELVVGENLRQYLATPRDLAARRELLVQVTRGLAAAHAAGVTHRDIKPENIFVGRDGRVRVGDFGLAGAEHARGTPVASADRITRTNTALGTPAYMSPEQQRGEPATAASDQFSLATMAWEVLFGERPPLDRARPPEADPRLVAVLQRALAEDPAARFHDLTELERAFGGTEKRDRRWLAIAALVPVAVIGILVARSSPAPCDTSTAWTPAARIGLAAAFSRTGSPIAGDAYLGVAHAFDRWSSRYHDVAAATCRSDHAEVQTPCLAGARDALAGSIAVMQNADGKLVERAIGAALALEAPDTCTTPHPAANIPGLGRLRALRRSGRFNDAIAAARAMPQPDPETAANVELELGISLAALGKTDEARDHLSTAAARADAARDDRVRAEALVQAVNVTGDHDVDMVEAARLEEQARAAVERAGSPPLLYAQLLQTLGDVATRRGKYDAAEKLFEEAVRVTRTQQDPVLLASTIMTAAQVHAVLGDPAGALRELDEAKTIATTALGPRHPNVATIWISELQPLVLLERNADAVAAGEHAIDILEHDPDVAPLQLAGSLQNLAIAQQYDDRTADAIATLDHAKRLVEANVGPDHPEVANLLLNLAGLEKSAGRYDEAYAHLERVVAIWIKTFGPDHVDLARAYTAMGEISILRKQPDVAVRLLERALVIREHAGKNTSPEHLAHTKELLAVARQCAIKRSACVVE